MKINKKLNLVVPVERDNETLYVHSMPISREVFERYYRIMSKAHAALFREQIGLHDGPRIAALMIKDMAQQAGEWESKDGFDGVEQGLMNEVRRLSNVISLTPEGWRYVPLHTAVLHGKLDEDEVSEVENQICFFILNSALYRKTTLPLLLSATNYLWGSQTTLLNATEFASSLRTSTETETTEKKAVSSVPV